MMLTTPFGCIKIIADGHEIAYEAIPYNSTVKSIKLHPLTGSYCFFLQPSICIFCPEI